MAIADILHILWLNMALTMALSYYLPPHSTHLMQPLDVACFGLLSKAYRTALQDFIYENPGRSFGKQEFWECLCIACDKALSISVGLKPLEYGHSDQKRSLTALLLALPLPSLSQHLLR